MLKFFNADLHIHTCLSPCADLRMSPGNIVAEALKKRLDAIAICDHNSAKNVPAVLAAAKGKGIVVLPGMEVCTREEAHVLAIFENVESDFRLQELVYRLLSGVNDPEAIGMQVIANAQDEVEGYEEKLLIGAADLSVDQLVDEVHLLGGIAIASHIDRETYSVIGQLGFIPDSLRFDGLELTRHVSDEEAWKRFPEYRHYAFVRNSDAHNLDDIGTNTGRYLLAEPSFGEFVRALNNTDGRKVTSR